MHIVIISVADIKIYRAFGTVSEDIYLIKMIEASVYFLRLLLGDSYTLDRQVGGNYPADFVFNALGSPVHIKSRSERLTEYRAGHIVAEANSDIRINIMKSHCNYKAQTCLICFSAFNIFKSLEGYFHTVILFGKAVSQLLYLSAYLTNKVIVFVFLAHKINNTRPDRDGNFFIVNCYLNHMITSFRVILNELFT